MCLFLLIERQLILCLFLRRTNTNVSWKNLVWAILKVILHIHTLCWQSNYNPRSVLKDSKLPCSLLDPKFSVRTKVYSRILWMFHQSFIRSSHQNPNNNKRLSAAILLHCLSSPRKYGFAKTESETKRISAKFRLFFQRLSALGLPILPSYTINGKLFGRFDCKL